MKTDLAGFETHREGDMLLLSRGTLSEFMSGRPFTDLASSGENVVEGRRSHTILDMPDSGKAVVRHYVHGGLLRKVTGERFAGSRRFLDEVRVSEHLRACGVNTPEVLGLLVHAGKLGFCRGALVTRMVEEGQDLLDFLRSSQGRALVSDPAARRKLLRSAAVETRKMHDSGVLHADLHVKNLLLGADGSIFILDLDRARMGKKIGRNGRLANLIRLGRSLEKTKTDAFIGGRDTYVFFLEYLKAGPPLGIDARKVTERYRRHVMRHRLFWKLGIR